MLNINLKGNNLEIKNFIFLFPQIKMDNMKVPQLKAEAKRLGLKNYSRFD